MYVNVHIMSIKGYIALCLIINRCSDLWCVRLLVIYLDISIKVWGWHFCSVNPLHYRKNWKAGNSFQVNFNSCLVYILTNTDSPRINHAILFWTWQFAITTSMYLSCGVIIVSSWYLYECTSCYFPWCFVSVLYCYIYNSVGYLRWSRIRAQH